VAFSVARPASDFCRQRPSGIDLDRPPTPVGTPDPVRAGSGELRSRGRRVCFATVGMTKFEVVAIFQHPNKLGGRPRSLSAVFCFQLRLALVRPDSCARLDALPHLGLQSGRVGPF
jgi:hypothetical protein